MRYVLVLFFLISIQSQAGDLGLFGLIESRQVDIQTYESFTYHDWCELKLNSGNMSQSNWSNYTLKDYQVYLDEIQDCKELPYLSSDYSPQIFELANSHHLTRFDYWSPLAFLKDIEILTRDVNHYEKEYDKRNVSNRGPLILTVPQKIKKYKREFLKDTCTYYIKEYMKVADDCNYFHYLNLLGVKSLSFFEEISQKGFEKHLKAVTNINLDEEEEACLRFANLKYAWSIFRNEGQEYSIYLNMIKVCHVLVRDLLLKKPTIVSGILENNYYTEDNKFDDLATNLQNISKYKEAMYFFGNHHKEGAIDKIRNFIGYHYDDDGNLEITDKHLIWFSGIKDQSFFEQFKDLSSEHKRSSQQITTPSQSK